MSEIKSKAIYNSMKKLIQRKFYDIAEEAQAKLDTYYACDRLSDEEYTELLVLIEEIYGE